MSTENSDNLNENNHKDARFAYDKLLQLRDLDNTLMWTRINLLLVFQSVLLAVVAGAFRELLMQYFILYLMIIFFGIFSSIILYIIAKGGSWWVSHWEKDLAIIEESAIGDINIFREHSSTDPNIKMKWKKEGYVSVRDSILIFSSILPIFWMGILLISIIVYIIN